MTTVALITDTHFGVRNDSPVFHDYFERSMSFFFNQIEALGLKHVIHLGDLFDRRKYLNYVTARTCRQTFLQRLESMDIETHVIAGNHDTYWKNTNDVNSLDEMVTGRYKGIHTYTEPAMINIDGRDIQLMPWINSSNTEECHKVIANTTAKVLMGHLEIDGFELFKGIISDHGDSKDIFSRFDLVCSGHYHHKSTKDNINYLGAFMEHTWADYNDPRGFHVFDTDTLELTFVPNPYKIFKMVVYDDKNEDMMKQIEEIDFDQYKDCYVKVVCLHRTNPYVFDMLIDRIYKALPIDISVVEDVTYFTGEDEELERIEDGDTVSLISNYIKGLTLPVENAKMTDYMKDLYVEAISLEHVDT